MNGNNRYTPNYNPDDQLTLAELIFIQNLAFEAGYDSTKVPLITVGTAAPATAPSAVGDLYVDTVNDHVYIATGTSVVGDWTQVDGGGSGGGVTVSTPTGTVNSVNTSFTVAATPKWIVADGITYFEGAGYSISVLTVIMDIPPSQFIRAIT